MLKSFSSWLTGQTTVDTWLFILILFGFVVGFAFAMNHAAKHFNVKAGEQKNGE